MLTYAPLLSAAVAFAGTARGKEILPGSRRSYAAAVLPSTFALVIPLFSTADYYSLNAEAAPTQTCDAAAAAIVKATCSLRSIFGFSRVSFVSAPKSSEAAALASFRILFDRAGWGTCSGVSIDPASDSSWLC